MSKGHGRVEQAILSHIADAPEHKGIAMSQLAAAIYEIDEPTRSNLVSVRRAVGRLVTEGLAKTFRDAAYPTPGRSYQRAGHTAHWCTGPGQRWQLQAHPGHCFHCEASLAQLDDGDGPYHLPPVVVRDVVETWVRRP